MKVLTITLTVFLMFFSCEETLKPVENEEDVPDPVRNIQYTYTFGSNSFKSSDGYRYRLVYTKPGGLGDKDVTFVQFYDYWDSDVYQFNSGEYVEFEVTSIGSKNISGLKFTIELDDEEWKSIFLHGDKNSLRIYGIIP